MEMSTSTDLTQMYSQEGLTRSLNDASDNDGMHVGCPMWEPIMSRSCVCVIPASYSCGVSFARQALSWTWLRVQHAGHNDNHDRDIAAIKQQALRKDLGGGHLLPRDVTMTMASPQNIRWPGQSLESKRPLKLSSLVYAQIANSCNLLLVSQTGRGFSRRILPNPHRLRQASDLQLALGADAPSPSADARSRSPRSTQSREGGERYSGHTTYWFVTGAEWYQCVYIYTYIYNGA